MNKSIIVLLIGLILLSSCSVDKNESSSNKQDIVKEVSLYDIDYNSIPDEDTYKEVYINETVHNLRNTDLNRYMYTDKYGTIYPAGMPIIIKENTNLSVNVINNTRKETNIHWHGLSLPNDQDGPSLLIDANGGNYSYSFTPDYSGSYWYHSHNRPVRDQVDLGMHGPLIILNEADKQYSLDRIMILDDWLIDQSTGHMQIEGDVDTINGVSGSDIEPLVITNNDFVKLRLIQASTAKNTTLNFPFLVRVTHTDGIALETPYETNTIELSPGERYDIDFRITESKDQSYTITNERDAGMYLPVYYSYEKSEKEIKTVDYKVEREDTFSFNNKSTPDIEIRMDSTMSHGKGHEWTLNGEVFPDAEEFDLELNKEYIIRFKNDSRMFNHPMHIHGAHFKVLNTNGVPSEKLLWKDTINVLANEYIDVAIRFDNPGDWMLHCHILDHEDGGMMTTIKVK